ncbi:Linearmycin resistance ATP-binding protein LnrL [Methylobacterium hispanicum]|uniref:Linearmycin resistance ATP-binding protein LnrL n=1 Tax=Methylobacterium hispanicum TaxID=270350 RepID=A0AAV4ZFY9_9HYPH|nr:MULTISPECIES: ABC transporter ATP-binding protein [Methylobacterium]GJD87336.1 Linearmycin resistance ATP-binding protein LnrL [Methylobacterium hispanicum]
MAPLLACTGLGLAYRGRPVLDGLDLALDPGEILALLGPNGAGKTTLMRLVAGRLVPGAGTVRVSGRDPRTEADARRRVGWVPQEIALWPRLSVAENLGVFASLAGLPRRGRRGAVAAMLALADIEAVGASLVGQLSGGYQRRVNIAAGLIGQPPLVLLDEPTQGVDRAARAAIHAMLRRLRRAGTAILVATHDFAEAERLADRVAFLRGGRIVREGPLAALLAGLAAGPPERELVLAEIPDDAAERALRRAGFAPDAELAWRETGPGRDDGAGPAQRLDGAALLGRLRAEGVPVSEVRVRAPGLEALYRDALETRARAAPALEPAR